MSLSEAKKLETLERMGKVSEDIWVIYAGTLGDHYDITTMIEAAGLLKNRTPNIKMLIAGNGPARERVVEHIKREQLTNVIYLGVLEPNALWTYYQASDIGLCSYAKGSTVAMPTKVYDYLIAGLPMASCLDGEIANLLQTHQLGLQYLSGDAESLSNVLQKLALDDELRGKLAHNCYEFAAQFDQPKQYHQFSELLDKIHNASRARQPER